MSKSHKLERSRILLTDTPEEIRKKISSALTDSISGLSYEPETRPGISNLLDILSIFDADRRSPEELVADLSEYSPQQLKSAVSDAIIDGLDGIGERYQQLLQDEKKLDDIENKGARKARESAEETMSLVRAAVGL
ncbi:Tryptophan--tRNA ligase, mitochondrial [Lecanicillium sp. MT-2017a]|nr:Tryptophan--tRNA ligase, mitochondrial [Lecanicillium sp. MT-2017a]